MNAATRVISGTRKFDRGLTRFVHDWLDVPQRTTFKLRLLLFMYLHGLAPQYLAELCVSVADAIARRNLRSTTRGVKDY